MPIKQHHHNFFLFFVTMMLLSLERVRNREDDQCEVWTHGEVVDGHNQ